MKRQTLRSSALVAVAACVLGGCAGVPQSGVESGAADVKVYGSDKVYASQYDVVGRVWVDSWRTAYSLPTYPSEAEGVAALQTEAGRLGANGLINVICMDQGKSKWWSSPGPAIVCYGTAIRMRQNAG